MYLPFTKWKPFADATEEGVLSDVQNIIPTFRGFRSSPQPVKAETVALAADCRGFSSETALAGTKAVFAGTAAKLYMKSGAAWTDVTRATDYSLGTGVRWCFTTQGNVTIAVASGVTPQAYVHGSSTDFADVAAMPTCIAAEALGRHLLVGNLGGAYTADAWACSKIDDYTNWTPSVDDQCVFGRLVDTTGPITALKRLSDYVIYYKSASIYLARYVGVPEVFSFSLVSDNVGAVAQDAVVRVGRIHYFCGETNFYAFDSATLTPIGDDIALWFNSNCNNAYRNRIISTKDESRDIVYWFYPSNSSTTPDKFVAYHYTTGRWGKGDLVVQAANEYFTTSPTYSNILTLYPTYAAFVGETYYELFYTENSFVPAVIGTDKILKLLTGESTTSTITTNDFGTDGRFTTITRVRPRFVDLAPVNGAGSLTNYYREHMGENKTEDATSNYFDGKFDFIRNARWHSGKFDFTGTYEIAGIDIEARGSGKE